ncbi:MAG TPA: GTP-binding protein [Acinetobacter venetianus]|uniref:LeoA/HP0731 family dynamin-like GTPase n=1 Tax=Acinetobacter venetianus TaxID=52133 RepID=UPI001A13471E|nr:LeoA/HP0731 family dynamin-like GTPase [Acinetobacter venetianus]HIQ35663.1 GTP-binding protein [Acinetobacter venetianus]
MEQFKQYNLQKDAVISQLSQLKDLVVQLDDVGIDSTDALKKIENSIDNVKDDTLRIALLGAFSDGKTSVIAGWLGHVMDNMKIDSDESSNELAIYRPNHLPEKCEIVDTPGLFGDKQQQDGRGKDIQYGDITRKYISEAHLIFYVVDAVNPLKESHKDTVQWILRDLNKLSSTIFIINKMDEVADLRDEDEFSHHASIKKENLLGKLDRFIQLTVDERNKINIVCLASNPNGRGLDFWFGKKDIYDERSRIAQLKTVTNQILTANTKQNLIKKTGLDVVKDVLVQNLTLAESQYSSIDSYVHNTHQEIHTIERDLEKAKCAFIDAKFDLLTDLQLSEKNLLGAIRSLTPEDIKLFVDGEIGYSGSDVGYKLRQNIELVCQRHFIHAASIVQDLTIKVEHQLYQSEQYANALSKAAFSSSSFALKQVGKLPVNTIKTGVFAARDVLSSITGLSLKFKPWGAANLAAGIGKWAGPIGIGITIFSKINDHYQQQKAEQEFIEAKNQINALVMEHFKTVYDLLGNDETAIANFAPQLGVFQQLLQQQRQELDALKFKKEKLIKIAQDFKRMGSIDTVFREA